jgi:hypothetical protein
VNRDQLALGDPPVDSSRPKPDRQQLPSRDVAVLPLGQLRDFPLYEVKIDHAPA